MRITKPQVYTSRPVAESELSNKRGKGVAEDGAVVANSADQVGLSEEARLMNQVKKAISESADIRQEKVEYYRGLISRGEYVIEPDKIAEKMLEEIL